jgi:diguanylate cyclase (GGDEF)-like protein/PAS domain S-box-containing protein
LNAPALLELSLGGERIDAVRVDALFAIAKAAYATTLAAGALLLALLWGSVPPGALAAWFGALVLVTLARIAVHRGYRVTPDRHAPRGWEARFAAGAAAAGLAWAVPVLAFFPTGEPVLQMALVLVTAASAVGAAGVYAASRWAFYGFCVPPILAVVAQLAQQPDRSYLLLAALGLVFAAAMLRVYRDMHGNLVSALRTRAEKEMLLERVAASEARLREAIEGFPDGIAVFDEAERLAACNETYAGVYGAGRDAAALAGASARDIAEAARAAGVPGPADGDAQGPPRQFRSPDGRWKQARSVATPRGGLVSVFTDITEAKRAQAAYQAVLDVEHLVLDALPVGVAFVENRVIARCNARLEHMLGYAAGELAGRPARVLYPSEEAWRSAGATLYEKLRGGGIFEGEGPLARKDGARLWCHALVRAIIPDAPQDSVIAVFSDESERRTAQLALRRSESLYRSLVETSNDLVWSTDREGRWTYLNPQAVRRIYGGRPEDFLGRVWHQSATPPLRERDAAVLERVLAGEPVHRHDTRHQRRDGSGVDLSFNAVPLRDAQGAIVGATGTARDTSDERAAAAALHESVEKLRLAVDAAELVYWEWDQASGELHWGRNPMGRLGVQDGRTVPWSEYLASVHPEDRERYLADARAAWERNETYAAEYRVVSREGQVIWISAHGKTLADAAGVPARIIGVSQDITERKRREETERHLAYHDTLTGLPNRRLLDDRLRQALHLAQRRDARLAVMLVDLDGFKEINDRRGHRTGDAVLLEVARRLAACVRKADTLARQGGDEFVVVISEVAQETDCQVVADKILRALASPARVEGEELRLGASIGVSLYPADAGDGEALLRNADAAMYRAKRAGGNQIRYFGR